MTKMKDMIEETPEDQTNEALDTEVTVNPLAMQSTQLESEDVTFPRMRIGQGLTPEVMAQEAKPGQIILTGFDAVDDCLLIPIAVQKRREYRAERNDRFATCYSEDSYHGEGNPGGDCDVCPLSKWTNVKDGKNIPPACQVQYRYLFYSITHGTPCVMDLKRTAVPAATALNTQIQMRGTKNFVVSLNTTQRTGPNHSWFVPQFRTQGPSEEYDEAFTIVQEFFG